jgi:sugar lactone lactonase YvrE
VLTACWAVWAAGCGEEPMTAEVEVLARGPAWNGANGILFGPDGLLWVASVFSPGLFALDPETGEVVHRLGREEGVDDPDDLAFGPDGSVYWTDILSGEVGRRTPAGVSSTIASAGPGFNPITFSDDGRLLVSQCFFGDKLYEVDPEGERELRLVNGELGPGCGLNGMDFGPDGMLYGPRWFLAEVARVNIDTGAVESVAKGFSAVAAVKFDSRGRLHVLDPAAGEVIRIDLESGAREVVARLTPGLDNLAFDSEDRLFVSSFADGTLYEVLGPNEHRVVAGGDLVNPGGLALVSRDGRDRLFVAEFFALRELDPVSGSVVHVERDVIGFSDLGSVTSVAPFGEWLVLTTWFGNEVRLWDPNAHRLVAKYEGFEQPVDATGFLGEIVVAENGSGSVRAFRPERPEQRRVVADGLSPTGLTASADALFVSDRTAGTVTQLAGDGAWLAEPRTIATGLDAPEGLAFAGPGALYVVESGARRLSRIDLASGDVRVIAEDLALGKPAVPVAPPSMILNGVAVGSDGRAYVSGEIANVIYRIRELAD